MGSPDAEYGRQLDGMGGGISSLSKVMVVGAPSPEQRAQGIDAEYTFAQVGITEASVDYSGNCGNLTSMIGVFAVDEGLCPPPAVVGGAEVGRGGAGQYAALTRTRRRSSTRRSPVTTAGTPVLDLPETEMAGVPGKASRIVLDFVDPGRRTHGAAPPHRQPLATTLHARRRSDRLRLPRRRDEPYCVCRFRRAGQRSSLGGLPLQQARCSGASGVPNRAPCAWGLTPLHRRNRRSHCYAPHTRQTTRRRAWTSLSMRFRWVCSTRQCR